MSKILVVDDERSIRLVLERLLKSEGYDVVTAESGEKAIELTESFDLALLDINLGYGPSGIDVLEHLHTNHPDTVVILLTGQAALETAVAALRRGAHDYLFKPCQPEEIRASVRKGLAKKQKLKSREQLINRLEKDILSTIQEFRSVSQAELPQAQPPTTKRETSLYTAGRVTIDIARHIALIDQTTLQLSPIEFDLLKFLVKEAPQVVTPQQLVRAIHAYDADPMEASSVIRTHIYRIRQKVKEFSGTDDIIRTVRGVGYAISE